MENKNNNGRGIFYGVIGVATLVVAIVGATFAYFTASVSTNNSPINVAATRVTLEITEQQSNLKANLIPVDTINDDGAVTAFYRYPGLTTTGKGAGTCTDNVGNSICSVYQVTVTNPTGSATQNITGSLTVAANTGFDNLKYAVFSGNATQVTSYNVNDDPTQATQAGTGKLIYAGDIGDAGDVSEWITGEGDDAVNYSQVQLTANQSATYTIVVWLEDTGDEQNDEQGAVFAANVTFKSAEGSEVTGVITAA